jgi:hypothetical protein
MPWVLLASLTVLSIFAATGLALRTRPAGRAEMALTTSILWNVLLGCPIYALGLTNRLTATTLAISSAAFFVLVVAWVRWRGTRLREVTGVFVELAFLPFEAIARAARARSAILPVLILAAGLIVYTGFASYFSPSWRQWDSLWYHETIIGFTIQNHGMATVDLPDGLQKVNGYPRFCEMIQMWFVIFTDRRLIEFANSAITPGLMYATYVIARRYTKNVLVCVGWAAVVVVMPTTEYLLQSTYIDIHVALFVLAGTHYATRPVFRIVDAWLAAVCVTLAVGAKYLTLPPAFIITLIAIVRLLLHHGVSLRSFGTMAGGFLLIAGMSATIFWRNWVHFKNPLWPDFQYDNEARHIHFPGIAFQPNALDLNMPVNELIKELFAVPYSNHLGPKGQVYDYGFAVVWFLFPFGTIAALIALWHSIRHFAGAVFRVPQWTSPMGVNALLVALPVMTQVYTSPALWSARYHIANVAALACLVTFWGGRRRWHAFGEALVAGAALSSLIVFYWLPRWYWLPTELADLAHVRYPEREVTPASAISKDLDVHAGSSITKEAGLAREKLKPGDIVVFDGQMTFVALLWNNNFSNKVLYVPSGPNYFDRVMKTGARMVYCQAGDQDCSGFTPAAGWTDVGTFNVENWGRLLERTR